MSNLPHDNLEDEDEAKALAATIHNMSGDETEDEDDADESSVLMGTPKKKKPVLKIILGVGGALVIAMGGLVAYDQFMSPPTAYVPPARTMPTIDPAPQADQVKSPDAPTGSTTPPDTSSPGFPGSDAATGNAAAPTPFDSGSTPGNGKKDVPDFGPAPVEKQIQTTKLNDVLHVEANIQAEVLKVLPVEKKVKNKVAKTVKKKVAKKSAKNTNVKKPVLPLQNQQQIDNGYNELF